MRSKSLWLMLILLALAACTTAPAALPNSAQATPIATIEATTAQTAPTLAATEPATSPQTDLLVYQAWDDGPQPELIVLQPDGTEVRRIALPKTVEYIENLIAMRGNHTALAVTADGHWFVIRVAQGEAQELDFPAELRGKIGLGYTADNGGRRWVVLEDEEQQHFYLIDLKTGQMTDLTTINKDFRFIDKIQLSLRDDYLAIFTKNAGLWLVPTKEPSKARRVKTTLPVASGYLSDDGQYLVFRDKPFSTKPVLIIESVDSGDRREIE